MTYAEFEYYEKNYQGRMSKTEFEKYVLEASLDMETRTKGRISEASEQMKEKIKVCCCKLADLLREQDALPSGTSGISSESNDGVSVAYRRGTGSIERQRELIMRRYLLAPENLMYTGVNRW